jgi:hypothetical protein
MVTAICVRVPLLLREAHCIGVAMFEIKGRTGPMSAHAPHDEHAAHRICINQLAESCVLV